MNLELDADRPELARLVGAWRRTADGDQPEWTAIRGLLDRLRRSRSWCRPPLPGGPERADRWCWTPSWLDSAGRRGDQKRSVGSRRLCMLMGPS